MESVSFSWTTPILVQHAWLHQLQGHLCNVLGLVSYFLATRPARAVAALGLYGCGRKQALLTAPYHNQEAHKLKTKGELPPAVQQSEPGQKNNPGLVCGWQELNYLNYPYSLLWSVLAAEAENQTEALQCETKCCPSHTHRFLKYCHMYIKNHVAHLNFPPFKNGIFCENRICYAAFSTEYLCQACGLLSARLLPTARTGDASRLS